MTKLGLADIDMYFTTPPNSQIIKDWTFVCDPDLLRRKISVRIFMASNTFQVSRIKKVSTSIRFKSMHSFVKVSCANVSKSTTVLHGEVIKIDLVRAFLGTDTHVSSGYSTWTIA